MSGGRRWRRSWRRADRRGRRRRATCGGRWRRSSGGTRTARSGGPCRPNSGRGGGPPSSSSAGPSSGRGNGCWKRRRRAGASSAWRSSTAPASGRTTRPRVRPKRSHAGGWRLGLVGRGRHRTAWRRPMPTDHPATTPQAAGRAGDAKLFASLELSKSRWLVTVSAPGSEKLSKHAVSGGDGGALLDLLARLRATAERRAGVAVQVVVIQEAGLDGFWVHRLLEANGIESRVVDPASIVVDRRHRRAKTDAIDGEKLVRTLMAWARGERRVCSMVRPPSPEEEDRRRLTRERGTLLKERTRHTNRIRGLLAGQGVTDYDPLRKDRLARPDALRTGDGRPLPARLKAEIRREIERVELVASQMAAVERERDALVGATADDEPATAAAALARLKGIGTELG